MSPICKKIYNMIGFRDILGQKQVNYQEYWHPHNIFFPMHLQLSGNRFQIKLTMHSMDHLHTVKTITIAWVVLKEYHLTVDHVSDSLELPKHTFDFFPIQVSAFHAIFVAHCTSYICREHSLCNVTGFKAIPGQRQGSNKGQKIYCSLEIFLGNVKNAHKGPSSE